MSTFLSPNKYPSNAPTNTYVYDFTVGTAYSTNTPPSSQISNGIGIDGLLVAITADESNPNGFIGPASGNLKLVFNSTGSSEDTIPTSIDRILDFDLNKAGYFYLSYTGTTPAPDDPGTYTSTISVDNDGTIEKYFFDITISPLCIATNTIILMANGQTKLIQHMKRGDVVSSDPFFTNSHVVAYVENTKYRSNAKVHMCEFYPNCLDQNIPSNTLLITSGHPIIHHATKTRRPASVLAKYSNSKIHDAIQIGDIVEPIENDENRPYQLWDLQFETIGSYVANGVTIQSRHPRSNLTPLPKELYFDQSLYTDKTVDDFDSEFEYPLIFEQI